MMTHGAVSFLIAFVLAVAMVDFGVRFLQSLRDDADPLWGIYHGSFLLFSMLALVYFAAFGLGGTW